ncbi:MAG: TGS domain-containing protein, partial [Phycisphaeraceae bacterium]
MKIILPDGSEKQFADQVTAEQVAADIGAGLAKAAIGAKVNGELVDLRRPIRSVAGADEAKVEIVTAPRQDKQGRAKFRDEQHARDALYLLRHSTAHVMAEAIERLVPDAQLAYGPPLDTGFYYDIS